MKRNNAIRMFFLVFVLSGLFGCGRHHETETVIIPDTTTATTTTVEKLVIVLGGDIVEYPLSGEPSFNVLVSGFPGSNLNFPASVKAGTTTNLVFTSPGPASDNCPLPGIFTKEDGQPIKRLAGKDSAGVCDGLFCSRPTLEDGRVFFDTHNAVDGAQRIYSIPFGGGDRKSLVDTNFATHAVFRGGSLFYVSNGGAKREAFSGNTGKLIPSSLNSDAQSDLAPSKDGRFTLVALGRDNSTNLAIFDGTGLRELTPLVPGVCDIQAHWTGDEKKVVFRRLTGTPSCFSDTSPSVFTINADGSGLSKKPDLEGATFVSIAR